MRAYVICANDSVESVCLDRETALATKERLSKEHYAKTEMDKIGYLEYSNMIYWRIHEVEVVK